MTNLITQIASGGLFFQAIFFITIIGVLISVYKTRSSIERKVIRIYFIAYALAILTMIISLIGIFNPYFREMVFILDKIIFVSIIVLLIYSTIISRIDKISSWTLSILIIILSITSFQDQSDFMILIRAILSGIIIILSYFTIISFLTRSKKIHKKPIRKRKKYLIIILSILFLIIGIFATMQLTSMKSNGKELIIYSWEEYLPGDVIPNFENEFGVNVTIIEYSDSLEMIENLESGKRYDLIITDDITIKKLISKDQLYFISTKKIKNFKNILPSLLDKKYDPENKYSIPYMWGTTGILINPKFVDEEEISWGLLWDNKYFGHMSMMDSATDSVGIASLYLYSKAMPGSMLERLNIEKFLKNQKPLLKGYFDEIQTKEMFLSEELYVSPIYNGEAMEAISQNSKLEYFIPKEGGVIWIDGFVIPKNSQNKKMAREFIDYILRAEVSAELSNELEYTTSNEKAWPLISERLLNNPAFLPPLEILSKLEYQSDYEIPEEEFGFEEEIFRRVLEE